MNTLIIGSGSPVHLRQPFVSDSELFSSPAVGNESGCVYRPVGDFPLSDYLRLLPDPWRKPDLIVTLYAIGDSLPRNMAGVSCPKILIVSDTHHGPRPITAAVKAAEGYDLVVLQYTPQHVHWFQEAGCKRTAWIPCFGIKPDYPPSDYPPSESRSRGITFVGNCTPFNPRRNRILAELEKLGIAYERHTADHEITAKIHSESSVCINTALNNDFNLRNFEVMAAGGFLLTEKVPGSEILDDGDACRLWSTVDELAKLCRYYLRYPAKALAIAQAGYEHYWSEHSPAKKRAAIMEALAMAPNPTPKPHLWERLAAYEAVQEMRRLGMGMDDLEDLR